MDNWAKHTEAEFATRYAPTELNRLPPWMEELADTHKIVVAETLGNELTWELSLAPDKHGHSSLIHALSNSPRKVVGLLLGRIENWLIECGGLATNTNTNSAIAMSQRLRQITDIILNYGDENELAKLHNFAVDRLGHDLIFQQRLVWLMALMRINSVAGIGMLEKQIETVEPAEESIAVTWFANVFGDRQDPIGLSNGRFNPRLLLRLVRFVYKHVRIQDDVERDGSYTPDVRDDAEVARNRVLRALFEAKGDDGWAAKLKLASDPLCAHIKDRILAVAMRIGRKSSIPFLLMNPRQLLLIGVARRRPLQAMPCSPC